jgi:excisionase family DNA binding protein
MGIEMGAEERWVGVENVAAHLGVAKDSVYRWIEEQGLPAHRVGRLLRFKLSEIDEWVRQDNRQAKTPSNPKTRTRSRKKSGNE